MVVEHIRVSDAPTASHPDKVRGVVLILGVGGIWSRNERPGAAVCSDGRVRDDAIATDLDAVPGLAAVTSAR